MLIQFNPKTIKNTRFVYEQAEDLFIILLVFLTTSHYIACMWIFIGYESKKEPFLNGTDKYTSNDWITNGGFQYYNVF